MQQSRMIPRSMAAAAALLLATLIAAPALAGVVLTLASTRHEGDIKFDQGKLVITPYEKGKPPVTLDINDVLRARLRDEPDRAETPLKPTPDGRVPSPFESRDIGLFAQPGYAKFTNNVFSIKSAGATLDGPRDALIFVSQSAEGDAEVTARVNDVKDPRKVLAGVMIRASADPGAPFVALACSGNELRLIWRTQADEPSQSGTVRPATNPPITLRLVRRGDVISAFASLDGQDFKAVGSQSLPSLKGIAHFGLAVCGKDRGEVAGAHFQNLRVARLAGAGDVLLPSIAAATLKEGLMLRTGTFLVGAHIHQADANAIRFSKDQRRESPLSMAAVARLIFTELKPDVAARIPADGRGVVLRNGDFIEGEFRGVKDGRLQLSSVLFGLKSFERGNQAVAIAAGPLETDSRPAIIVFATDGSIYMGRSATLEKDRLIIEDALGGAFTLARDQVLGIQAGPGKLLGLETLKPAAVEPAGARITVNATGGSAQTLGGQPVERAITIPAGASASWNLAGQYRSLTLRAGVASAALPTAAARFIVIGDNRELFRSGRPRTSADEPLQISVELKGVKTLTLKAQPASSDAPLPIPTLWADPSLVK